jgi:2-polyprenyl-3-methyl-5-hydroxy-6-metoxy-1,4-benzoquinol methylase
MNEQPSADLARLIREKWAFSEMASDHFIQFKIWLENYQESNLRHVAYGFARPAVGIRVLDVGCGEGGFAVAAHRAGFNAYGVDINASNLDICRHRAARYGMAGDRFSLIEPGERFPFPDHSFDVVTLFEVLEHVPAHQTGGLLAEARRILAPSGFAYIEVPNALWPLEGHVDRHFVHWIPRFVRRIVLRNLFDSPIMRHHDYLEGIVYRSRLGWYRTISRHFETTTSPDALMLDFALGEPYSYGGYKTIKNAARRLVCKLPSNVVVSLYRNFGPLAVFIARP